MASLPQIAAASPPTLLHVLVALSVIVVLARAVGLIFRYLGQPPVIGEIASGILLGPSLLARVAPDVSSFLLPSAIAPMLKLIAEIGVILYMFLVGVDLDLGRLRVQARSAITVSYTSIIVPFVLGTLLAVWLYPRWAPQGAELGAFVLFTAISMSVTAFPVLARILTDRELHTTQLGAIALGCAAVDDVTAWCLLAGLVGMVRAHGDSVLVTVFAAVAFIVVVMMVLRPAAAWLARTCERQARLGREAFAAVCVVVLLAAVTTETIGIHALFGAFLVGVVVPHDSRLARELHTRLGDVTVVLLLPVFFAFTGMRTQIGLLGGLQEWLICGAIIAVAVAGKLGGSAVAARVTGLGWRHSLALGALLNTRGLMELIVLNVGLDLGVISPTLFTMFVIMALVTTAATAPIVSSLLRQPRSETLP